MRHRDAHSAPAACSIGTSLPCWCSAWHAVDAGLSAVERAEQTRRGHTIVSASLLAANKNVRNCALPGQLLQGGLHLRSAGCGRTRVSQARQKYEGW